MKLPILFHPERFLEHSQQHIRKDMKLAWGMLVKAFIKDLQVSELSKETYVRNIRKFIIWLNQEGKLESPDQLTREDLLEYKLFLKFSGLSAATINSYLILCRKLFEWLESKKLFPNIAKGIKGLKKPNNRMRDCFSVEQLKEILSGIDTTTLEGKRNFGMINLQARTGLRCIEISRANIEDLRQEGGEAVLWVQGKGRDSKDEFVLLVDETLKPIRDYLSARKPQSLEEPLFAPMLPKINSCTKKVSYSVVTDRSLSTRMVSMIAKRAFRAVGIDSPRLTAHSLRHTAISLAIQGGASLIQAQYMARHQDPATTSKYFYNISRVTDAAERYIKLNKYEDHLLPLTTKSQKCTCKCTNHNQTNQDRL